MGWRGDRLSILEPSVKISNTINDQASIEFHDIYKYADWSIVVQNENRK